MEEEKRVKGKEEVEGGRKRKERGEREGEEGLC